MTSNNNNGDACVLYTGDYAMTIIFLLLLFNRIIAKTVKKKKMNKCKSRHGTGISVGRVLIRSEGIVLTGRCLRRTGQDRGRSRLCVDGHREEAAKDFYG